MLVVVAWSLLGVSDITVDVSSSLFARILLAIRDVCVDWLDGKEKADDPALRGDKDPKSGYIIQLPRRCISLSSTQVSLGIVKEV